MKKLISVLCAFAMVFSCVIAGAQQDEQILAGEEKTLKISEQYSEKTLLTVTIASSDVENVNSANRPVFMYLYSTDSKGLFEEDITLSSAWNSGRYTVYIDAPSDARQFDFFYVNPESTASLAVVDSINGCTTGDELFELLTTDDNAALLGLDKSDELFVSYAKDALDYAIESKDGDFTFESFEKAFNDGLAAAKLLENIKNAEVYGELEDLVKENADILGVDFDGDYEDVKQKSKVFVEMFKNIDEIEDLTSVSEVFDDAVKKVLKDQKKTSSSGGSSSGSFGGSSTIVLPSTDPVEPIVPVIPVPDTSVKSYTDIDGHFAKDAVSDLSAKNIISGYPDGTFKPDNGVTRAEFAKIACLAFGYEPKVTGVFADVTAEDWFAGYADALAAAGIINGFDGMFNPNVTITRQDAACIIYRLINQKLSVEEAELFEDNADISDYAKGAVAKLRASAVVNGSNNMFFPLANITRGEAAVMITNALNVK